MSDPYEERGYTGTEMQELHSDKAKFGSWRRLWLRIAKTQKQLGMKDKKTGQPRITDEMISELEANVDNLNLERAKEIEKLTKHDVNAHIRAYGEQCPNAKGIIHAGCTSRAITDNAELMQIRDSLQLILKKVVNTIDYVAKAADQYAAVMTWGYTHFQTAQATTVGRRLAMHGEELLLALDDIEYRLATLPLRGFAGPVGTHTDMLDLFDGDHEKVQKLEEILAKELGFKKVLQCPPQTYHRMIDYQVGSALKCINIAARRFATTVRLLQGLKEIEEPFEETQVGSSAMAYKRNPKNSERESSLTYCLSSAVDALAEVAANQWLEGSVEDSAARRIKIREMFYAADGILELYMHNARGLNVYKEMIAARIRDELPLVATNLFLTECVKKKKDRQEMHEILRVHAQEAVKQYRAGGRLDFIDRILGDERIQLSKDEVDRILTNPTLFVGDAREQTRSFVQAARERIKPYESMLGYEPKVEV